MTMQDYTALVFVVDNSGSMAGIARDMEGAIKGLLDAQRELPGKLTVDYVRFSGYNSYEHAYKGAEPDQVNIQIIPGGLTAMNDAIGRAVDSVGLRLASTPEYQRPDKVLFAIVTDGGENDSREHTYASVAQRVKRQSEVYNWEFVYLGANQDAVATAAKWGIGAQSALTYNTANTGAVMDSLNNYVTTTRSGLLAGFSQEDRDNAL